MGRRNTLDTAQVKCDEETYNSIQNYGEIKELQLDIVQ